MTSVRTVPGAVDVMGVAKAMASVAVNGASAARKDEYFWKEVSVANGGAAVWQSLSVTATEGANNQTTTGNAFVPRTPENFTHDLDGNQLTDGRWAYTWDGENRLVRLVPNTAVGPQVRIDFEYDWQSRRIARKVWNDAAGTSGPKLSEKFLYDGWNLIAQLNATNNAVVRSYLWGSDLSGTMQGAGGVGGLLAVKDTANGTHFAAYDGNGNVTALVSAADNSVSARYEYGPFHELLRATGPLAFINPFRPSTKFQDDETGFLYYGYRYYDPSTGRWLSRDPIGEYLGGVNLYAFVKNEAISNTDYIGLFGIPWSDPDACFACRCEDVILGPTGNFKLNQVGDKLQGGVVVPRGFKTRGQLAPHFCKCQQLEIGSSSITINGVTTTKAFGDWNKPSTTQIPCNADPNADPDFPGFIMHNFPRNTELTIDLSVNLTITLTCDGTDGSHKEKTIEVSYSISNLKFTTP